MKIQLAGTLPLIVLSTLAHAQTPAYPQCWQSFDPAARSAVPRVDLTRAKLPLADYLDELGRCTAQNGEPMVMGPNNQPQQELPPLPEPKTVASSWLETDRRMYLELLRTRPVDVLVVPLQIQGYGFDRTERSIMSADLAVALGDKVADPFLVARALGEGRRRFAEDEIRQLAAKLKAKTVVVGYVGHLDRKNMFLTMQTWTMSGAMELHEQRRQKDWLTIPFSHETLPSMAFHSRLPEIVAHLGIATTAKARRLDKTEMFPVTVGQAPHLLATGAAKSWPASSASLLLAALAPYDAERTRDRMFERTLLTSMNADASSSRQRFTQAFALMQLKRRPAALRILKDDTGPAATVLRELLNGNLPEAKAGMGAVKAPFERLLLSSVIQDVARAYRREERLDPESAMQLFTAAPEAWWPLVALRLTDLDPWQVPDALQIKGLLDEILPQPGFDVASIVEGGAIVRDDYDDVSVDVATMRHLRKSTQQVDLSKHSSMGPGVLDLIWLLEATAESRLVKSLDMLDQMQARPREAAAMLDEYRPFFDGHPVLAYLEGVTATTLAQQSADDEAKSWRRKAHGAASLALEYAQGQGQLSHGAMLSLGPTGDARVRADAYGFDFPRRSYWPPATIGPSLASANGEPLRSLLLEGLAFNQLDSKSVRMALGVLEPPERANVMAQLQSRFSGVPGQHAPAAALAEPADPMAHYRAAIQKEPHSWHNYHELGQLLIKEQGDYSEAAKVFLSYPGFSRSAAGNAVARSNEAYEAGSLLYWHGKMDLAKPLYEFAAQLDTGSDASMSSAIRLDLLAGHYAAATRGLLRRATRYSSAYAYRDYLSLLHVTGHGKEAWLGFSRLAAQFDLPQVWVAALVGHRKDGLDEAGFKKWLMQPQIRDARFRSRQFALGYALMWSSTDVTPPADLGKLIDALEGTPTAKVYEDGLSATRPHSLGAPDRFEMFSPTALEGVPAKRLPPGTPVRSSLALFAEGYVSLRAGQHAEAIERFRSYVERYPIAGYDADPYPLAYIAAASAATGDPFKLEKHLQATRRADFDGWLAKAFFHAYRKEVDLAENALKKAFQRRPHTDYRPILTEYQFAEACEWIYQATGDARFKNMLLDWSKHHQQIQPTHAWAYAMQYTHESDPAARDRALAMTLYLDPRSPRIAKAKVGDVARAKQWLAKNNPFTRTDEEPVQARLER